MSKSQLLVLTGAHQGSVEHINAIPKFGGVAWAQMQLNPIVKACKQLFIEPRLLALDIDNPNMIDKLGTPDICIVGKINHFDDMRVAGFSMAALSAITRLKLQDVPVVALYCDNLASLNCVRGKLYRDILRLCDCCVVPCQPMAEIAKQWLSDTPVYVIEDPWQVRLQSYPTFQTASELHIAWFGSEANVHFLLKQLPDLMQNIDNASSVKLSVLTKQRSLDDVSSAFKRYLPSALRPWSLEPYVWNTRLQPAQLEDLLGPAHIAWLPSDPTYILKRGVSHNRLVDSIRSGCVVVSSPMSSYLELSKLSVLGFDHGYMINSLLPQYDRIALKHSSLRTQYLSRFSPTENNLKWINFIKGF